MSTEPTGRISTDGDGSILTITREFRAPIEDVWASVTESERLARWIGTFTGDPASGRVAFLMTAEGATEPGEMEIRECDPPRVLRVTSHVGEERWLLDLVLEEHDGVTTLTFSQPGIDPSAAESIGPGWEYYLDRLAAAESGRDVAEIDWDRDYYPAMVEHYRNQAR
ncbi:SRPBCC family protein [Marmoricola sp. URHB0036]|uniref:SRPBCC family protein n=1 Tax=Marmoricola sp. URHB0036 TaxID=1298863 RepID=UPI00040C8D54|nr:SRPBCC family protein [Marmoricola sp. URHB0036]